MTNIKANIIRRCIVKDSKQVRALLEERFAELELSGRDVIADALKHGRIIQPSQLSRYRSSGNVKASLSQQDIIWLCFRYGIDVKLISAKKSEYNEKECLKSLKKEFK